MPDTECMDSVVYKPYVHVRTGERAFIPVLVDDGTGAHDQVCPLALPDGSHDEKSGYSGGLLAALIVSLAMLL